MWFVVNISGLSEKFMSSQLFAFVEHFSHLCEELMDAEKKLGRMP